MLIKASGLTNLTDARYFAAKDVQFLGFNLEAGTPGYLDPMYMRAIKEWVQGPLIVGEYAGSPLTEVREAVAFFGLDAVQITSDYAPDLAELAGLTVLLLVDADQDSATLEQVFRASSPYVEHFILRFSTKNDLETSLGYEAGFWTNLCQQYSVLLHWDGLSADLPALLTNWPLAGLSLTGGEEEQVGVKSYDEIEGIFDWLEENSPG